VVPLAAIGAVVVATIALANLVAAVPARSASRTSPAIVLRAE
jgi:ABC-type lipoprotein release transport system permease subunit